MIQQVGPGYGVQYHATGGADDWVKGAVGIKWVYLIELPDKDGLGFLLPASHIRPVARSALAAVRAAAAEISFYKK